MEWKETNIMYYKYEGAFELDCGLVKRMIRKNIISHTFEVELHGSRDIKLDGEFEKIEEAKKACEQLIIYQLNNITQEIRQTFNV
jgi:hypothetical protein